MAKKSALTGISWWKWKENINSLTVTKFLVYSIIQSLWGSQSPQLGMSRWLQLSEKLLPLSFLWSTGGLTHPRKWTWSQSSFCSQCGSISDEVNMFLHFHSLFFHLQCPLQTRAYQTPPLQREASLSPLQWCSSHGHVKRLVQGNKLVKICTRCVNETLIWCSTNLLLLILGFKPSHDSTFFRSSKTVEKTVWEMASWGMKGASAPLGSLVIATCTYIHVWELKLLIFNLLLQLVGGSNSVVTCCSLPTP